MYHQTMLLFTKDIVNAYKLISVRNIPPLRFVVVPKKQVIVGIIQRAWNSEICVAVVVDVGVPVEGVFLDIRINSRRLVIHL